MRVLRLDVLALWDIIAIWKDWLLCQCMLEIDGIEESWTWTCEYKIDFIRVQMMVETTTD